MRKLAALVIFIALMLVACRSESERSAVARVAPGSTARSALDGTAHATAKDEPGPGLAIGARRVWASDYVDFYASAISPDGRYVTEVDWQTGDLAVRDLATGLLHRLTDKGPWEKSIDYASSARFSRDGRRLAYAWYDEATDDYEIRVLEFSADDAGNARGSDPRIVYPGGVPQPASVVYDWTSDDELLIGLYRPDDTTALALLALSTGSLRVLKSFEWGRDPDLARVSADGGFIVYDQPVEPGAADRDIHVLSIDGRRETKLTDGPGVDVVLGWVPGDGSLLFHRSRSGDGSVWRLPMSDGRPSGPARPVRDDVLAPAPIGFAGDAFYYGLRIDSPGFATATIDLDGRGLRRLPTRFEAPAGGRIRTFAWSPDGRHVLQEIDHPRSPGGGWIQLRTAGGELVHEWTLDLFIMFAVFRWEPDRNSVLVPANDARERPGFIRIDLDAGGMEMVLRFDRGGEFGRVSAISPDGRKLYFTRHEVVDGRMDESFAHVVEHDLATGAERRVERVRGHGALTMSPDGKWLALALGFRTGAKTIRVIPVRGGDGHTVYTGDEQASRLPRVLGWSADSGSLLFLDRRPSDDEADAGLYRVSRDGGDAERIATLRDYEGGADLHPDGRTIAYRTGESRGEIWALDGLGAPAPAATEEEGSR